MSETRRFSFWYVRCSRQSWRERAYSATTSVFGIPSFTSKPTICMNGWKRGKRKPTQHCKHFCLHFMRWVVSCAKTNFSEVVHPLYFSKNKFPLLKARPNSYLFTADLIFSTGGFFFAQYPYHFNKKVIRDFCWPWRKKNPEKVTSSTIQMDISLYMFIAQFLRKKVYLTRAEVLIFFPAKMEYSLKDLDSVSKSLEIWIQYPNVLWFSENYVASIN